MKKVMVLDYGRDLPTDEPSEDLPSRCILVESFRIVWGSYGITLKEQGEEFYLSQISGCIFYDGKFYSDIWVRTLQEEGDESIEAFDPKKSIIPKLPLYHKEVEKAINLLRDEIEVDGETMQYILEQVGMDEQMHKQLSNTYDSSNVEIERLERRLKLIKEDNNKLYVLIKSILTEDVMTQEDKDGCSITRLIGNIDMACDSKEKEVENWKDPK